MAYISCHMYEMKQCQDINLAHPDAEG